MNSFTLSFAWTEADRGQGYRLLADRGQGFRPTCWYIRESCGYWLLYKSHSARPIVTLAADLEAAMEGAAKYARERFGRGAEATSTEWLEDVEGARYALVSDRIASNPRMPVEGGQRTGWELHWDGAAWVLVGAPTGLGIPPHESRSLAEANATSLYLKHLRAKLEVTQ